MKKKLISLALCASLAMPAAAFPARAADDATEQISYNYLYDAGTGYSSDTVHTRRMEKLDRGLVAVKSGSGVFLSWRLFDSEDTRYGSAESNVSFNIYRNGSKIAAVSDTTNYTDTTVGTSYSVAPVVNGVEGEKCEAVSVLNNNYLDIPLTKPADETICNNDGTELYTASFFPADCSTGDLDGDGKYEIIVKWTSSEKDVGTPGDPAYSGTVRLSAYKLDGTKMWDNDINLGKNVYSSAHTVQFLVYDFDGDGKAEMMCQTSLGSKDALGSYVSHSAKSDSIVASTGEKIADFTDEDNANADYRGYGRVITGEEFLTIFSGETGAAIDTIDLPTSRGSNNGEEYGDDFGNRSNRFLADVAYLNGKKPYAVYLRGYYFGKKGKQRTSIAGISFDGERLSPDYRFDTKSGQPGYYDGAYQYVGQGNHNCTVADVDNDGKDEFITGALCIEVKDDGSFKPRWCTYLQHGDALHIGDYDPTHKGFEFFTVHEDSGTNTLSGTSVTMDFGMSVIDAETGEIMFHEAGSADTGRGLMANIGSGGFYQIGSAKTASYQSNGGTNFTQTSVSPGANFRIFWDGDLYDESLDGTSITSWNGRKLSEIFNAGSYDCVKINGTKSNPALQADLFGDWREELVYPTTDGNTLRVFTTTTPTEYKIKTLMHDPVYRSGVAAEQTAYNQPPHVGFYMGSEMFSAKPDKITITKQPNNVSFALGDTLDTAGMVVTAHYPDDTTEEITSYSVSGYDPNKSGAQTITVAYMGQTATYEITALPVLRISVQKAPEEIIVGNTLRKSSLVVYGFFENGKYKVLTDYELSCDTSELGSITGTVTYGNLSDTFMIKVVEPNISALNQEYFTTNTELTDPMVVNIGDYYGSFALTHTLTINSPPASASMDKETMSGFYMRFMPRPNPELKNPGVGGGWQITSDRWGNMHIYWKIDKATQITTTALKVGETYTFDYIFSKIGTGEGANVALTIKDSSGNVIGSSTNLGLRNMTASALHTSLPMNYIQIYNQATAESESSVTIDNATIYGISNVVSVEGNTVTLNMGTLSNAVVYAAKYTDGALTDIEILKPDSLGKNELTASFEPDKVFLWTRDMIPMDMWSK